MCAGCYLYFLIGNLTQNVYNGAGCYLYFLIENLTQNVYNGTFLMKLKWQMLENKNLL